MFNVTPEENGQMRNFAAHMHWIIKMFLQGIWKVVYCSIQNNKTTHWKMFHHGIIDDASH